MNDSPVGAHMYGSTKAKAKACPLHAVVESPKFMGHFSRNVPSPATADLVTETEAFTTVKGKEGVKPCETGTCGTPQ